MQALGCCQPVIQVRLEPVEQFPGQDRVRARIAALAVDEPARLLGSEYPEVGGGVTVA